MAMEKIPENLAANVLKRCPPEHHVVDIKLAENKPVPIISKVNNVIIR